MTKNYLLTNPTAEKLYAAVKDLPIVDYHCHLSAQEIYEDVPFDNLGQMWLGGDHYKWRLMRLFGIPEEGITGKTTTWKEKFVNFMAAVELAAGSPLYAWASMELSLYFGIDLPLTVANAEAIWEQANRYIKDNNLSPRKLIKQAGVEIICTTDDIADDLAYHKLLAEDPSFNVKVLPSYRGDKALRIDLPGWREYMDHLGQVAGVKVDNLASLKAAFSTQLDHFDQHGCRITDIGIVDFPDHVDDDAKADATLKALLDGETVSHEDYLGFVGNIYLYWGKLYKEKNMVMQWHLGVQRDLNPTLFAALGLDCGGDSVGDAPSVKNLSAMLTLLQKENALPRTIVYSLNEGACDAYATVCGCFRGVILGAAWWFADHKRGIIKQLNIMAEQGLLSTFPGMLTDSRSFLSYARHDYFRRILCNRIGEYVETNEFDSAPAEELCRRISYSTSKNMIEE